MIKDILVFTIPAVVHVLLQKVNWNTNNEERADVALRKALEDGTSLDAHEKICTVDDEHNVPTSEGHTRSEMRLNNLFHRATYIIVRHLQSEEMENDNGDGEKKETPDDIYVLVQRRSKLKDYCPGKLDPMPGGVVGFGETCDENAMRELKEEMGIDVSDDGSCNTISRLFTFPYADERVRVWGELYEVSYRGSMDDIIMQEEEVDDVIRMPMKELKEMVESRPNEFMPDALHAFRLYTQYRSDRSVGRRLLTGYSSGNLDAYKQRPKPEVIFFDCDDCLYFDEWKVANHLTKKIDEYCKKLGLKEGEAYDLYKKHGTALKGLLAEGHLPHCDDAIDEYLKEVHDLPISDLISKDDNLREILKRIDPTIPKYIFTASVHHHAERCLKSLGIDDMFDGIIDVKACDLATKHSEVAFQKAMLIAGVQNPESCIFLDDSITNIMAAREMGWRSILVGKVGRDCGKPIESEHAEHEIHRIHEMPSVLPELFDN